MIKDYILPEISLLACDSADFFNAPLKIEMIKGVLRRLVPSDFFSKETFFEKDIPVFKALLPKAAPGNLTISILSERQNHAIKFFIEIISSWLLSSKKLDIINLFSSEFQISSVPHHVFMVSEISLHVKNESDLDYIATNLKLIESEVRLGLQSSFYAKRILEVKGLSSDVKTAQVQEHIICLMERLPKVFESDMTTEMQHTLIICRDDFKKIRSSRLLARIIGIQYLFKKNLYLKNKLDSSRKVATKVFRHKLPYQNSKKNVLGVIVAVNFLREKEIFERRHVMQAIQNLIPDVVMVENSFFDRRRSPDQFCTLYLEIEKNSGANFTGKEISLLRESLANNLVDGIEELVHPIFMPRNEEEIMRSILALSGQVKFLRDLPQVTITFDEQTYAELCFTIIVMRVLKPGDDSIKDLFTKADSQLEYIHDRCKTVGYLRSKYIKEATVFRLKIDKEEFIRLDNSIDLNKARQTIVFELLKAIGEFRDFNGGMITKQNELLMDVKALLDHSTKYSDHLLENFFFSITPIVMRTIIEAVALKNLFELLLKSIDIPFKEDHNHSIIVETAPTFVFLIVKSDLALNREDISKALSMINIKPSEKALAYVKVHNINYHGYIFRSNDQARQEQFIACLKESVDQQFLSKAVQSY